MNAHGAARNVMKARVAVAVLSKLMAVLWQPMTVLWKLMAVLWQPMAVP